MRRITMTICLLILCVSFFTLCCPLGGAQSMKQKWPNRLGRLCFIPQGGLVLGTCNSEPNRSIRFWSTGDGRLKVGLDLGKGEWASSLAVSNSGSSIVVALLDKNKIANYSLTHRNWLWSAQWVGKGVVDSAIQFTPDDRRVVVVGFRNIATYDAHSGVVIQNQEDSKGFSGGFPNYRTRINAISPSSRYAAFWQGNLEHDEGWRSSRNMWVLVHDIQNGKVIAKQGKIQEKYKNCSAAFTPDEKNLVLGSMDGYIRVWSITEQKVIREWRAYGYGDHSSFKENPSPNMIESMAFSPDGQHLATMGFLKGRFVVKIWDYTTNKLSHEFDDVISSSLPMCSGYPMAFSPDGKYFAFEQQGQLCLYDTQTWQEEWRVPSLAEKKESS